MEEKSQKDTDSWKENRILQLLEIEYNKERENTGQVTTQNTYLFSDRRTRL